MFRRSAVVLAGLLVTGFAAAGTAAAAPVDDERRTVATPADDERHAAPALSADNDRRLTPQDQEGLGLAGDVLDRLLGGAGSAPRADRY